MSDEGPQNNPSPLENAESYYIKGLALKREGQMDAALTEFRRAILEDPNHQNAQLEVGRLCLEKSKKEPYLFRYAFDALRRAANLNRNDEIAQNEYILISQKMNRLDEVLKEYDDLLKQDPANEILNKVRKNVVTISLAMMPDKVTVESGFASKKIRTIILLASFGAILLGLMFIFGPPLLNSSGKKLVPPEPMKQLLNLGVLLTLVGLGGLITFFRLRQP